MHEQTSHPDAGDARAAASLLGAIKAHPLLIAIVTVLVALVAVIWSAARAPTYEASAQILVSPLPEDGGSDPRLPVLRTSSDRTRVIQTAANLLDSPAAASLTANRLGRDWTAARVAAMVDVLPEGESDVLSVTAKADDAALAARVANEYARSALEARGRALAPVISSLIAQTERELRSEKDKGSPVALTLAERLSDLRALGTGVDPTLSLTRPAEAPSSTVGASRSLLTLLGLLAGVAVGVGSALVLDMVGPPRIGNAEQAIAATGLPVLARVPGFGLWKRARPSLPLRYRPGAAAALRAMQYQLELAPGKRRRLLLAGASAGDGVTTCVAELGLTLARAGHRVLVVDLDTRHPDLAGRLGVTQPSALAEVRSKGEHWDSGLPTVPGSARLRVVTVGAYGSLGIPDDIAEALPRMLGQARRHFEYVLIDAPPLAESGEALRIAAAVDAVVLVLRPGRTPVQDLETSLDLLARVDMRPEGMLLVGGRAATPPVDVAAVGQRAPRPSGATSIGRGAEA
jgi:Mrp family chromosome partitioning ATPase/capsular polysaccharide biosynthesis protein